MTPQRSDSEKLAHLLKLGELVRQAWKTADTASDPPSVDFVDDALFTSWRIQGKHFIKGRYGESNSHFAFFNQEVSQTNILSIEKAIEILGEIREELSAKEATDR